MHLYLTSEERREYYKAWKLANPDKVKAQYERNKHKYLEKLKAKYEADPEKYKARRKKYYSENREAVLGKMKIDYRDLRHKVFEHYGGAKCACCEETQEHFLCIDHINGCTKEQRKREGQGSQLVRWLVRNGMPEGYRVLCANCNLGRERNGGVCPHQQIKDSEK